MDACCVGEGASEFVTAPGGGTGHSYTYDCNGSQLTNADFASGGSSYTNTWDPHNRLSVIAKTSPRRFRLMSGLFRCRFRGTVTASSNRS